MTARPTILQILPHSARSRKAWPEVVTDGWHARLGKALARYTEYEVECWTVDYKTESKFERSSGGITFRAFPSRIVPGTQNHYVRSVVGQSKPGVEMSLALVQALRRRAKYENVGVHLHGDGYFMTLLIARLFRGGPTFVHHHGGLEGMPRIQGLAFRDVDRYFVLTPERRDRFLEETALDTSKVAVREMGVDFERYVPRDIGPSDVDLEADQAIAYVGSFGEQKGFDKLLDVFERIRPDRNVALIAIGGDKSDPLYRRGENANGVFPVTEYISNDEVIDYYSAASVYASYPTAEAMAGGHSGIISPIEAIACGTPVVSPVLRHFRASDRSDVGVCPTDQSTFASGIERLLDGERPDAATCRQVAKNHFSWESVARQIAAEYDTVL